MKTIIFTSLFFIVSGCSKIIDQEMTVVRDCTGTYLRYEGNDYQVCNTKKTDAFADGTSVSAKFKNINDCRALDDQIICMMFHENQGMIEVTNIE